MESKVGELDRQVTMNNLLMKDDDFINKEKLKVLLDLNENKMQNIFIKQLEIAKSEIQQQLQNYVTKDELKEMLEDKISYSDYIKDMK